MNTQKNIRKVLIAIVATLSMVSAFAIPKGPCETKPDVCCEEPAPGPFAFSYAKDMGLSCPRDFYFDADYLLMQANEEGLEYAITQGTTANRAVFPLTEGDVQGYTTGSHSADWNHGVRLACGFFLNHDAWDVNAAWTYFRINDDSGINTNNAILLALWLDPGLTTRTNQGTQLCRTASARWTGDLHTLDLNLAKPYHISRYVVFNPFFGVRFGWVGQNYMARYGGDWYDGAADDINVDMISKNDFWGVGARTGLNTEWHVGSGWYLFGNVAAALLYSHFDVEQSVHFHNVEPVALTVTVALLKLNLVGLNEKLFV